MANDSNSLIFDIHLAEYKQLKDEQRTRIGARDNLVYVMLAVTAPVAYFATAGVAVRYPALLLLPLACFVLGWTHLSNDRKVSEIGQYLRADLASALSATAGLETRLLGWETTHRECAYRRRRKIIQAIADLAVFCMSGVAAVIAYWVMAPTVSTLSVAVSCMEIAGLLLLGFEIAWYADR